MSTKKRKRLRIEPLTHYQLSKTIVEQVKSLQSRSDEEQLSEGSQALNDKHMEDEPMRYMGCHGNLWNMREERDEMDRCFPPSYLESELECTPQ